MLINEAQRVIDEMSRVPGQVVDVLRGDHSQECRVILSGGREVVLSGAVAANLIRQLPPDSSS